LVMALISAAASSMSSRSFRDWGCIDQITILFGDLEKDGILHGGSFNQVNAHFEEIFKPVKEVEVSPRCTAPSEIFKVDKEVQVTSRGIELAAGRRPKQFQLPHRILAAKCLNLRTMMFN